jgi:hypothetical protein
MPKAARPQPHIQFFSCNYSIMEYRVSLSAVTAQTRLFRPEITPTPVVSAGVVAVYLTFYQLSMLVTKIRYNIIYNLDIYCG